MSVFPELSLGQTLDPTTDLMYYGARYYDPAIGRFISGDTIVPNPMNPQDLNRYSYVRNNPVLYNDPSGHDGCLFFWEDGSNGCVGGGLVEAVAEHRGLLATVGATALCVIPATGGGCLYYQGAAFSIRSQQTVEEQGWLGAAGDVAVDAAITGMSSYLGFKMREEITDALDGLRRTEMVLDPPVSTGELGDDIYALSGEAVEYLSVKYLPEIVYSIPAFPYVIQAIQPEPAGPSGLGVASPAVSSSMQRIADLAKGYADRIKDLLWF